MGALKRMQNIDETHRKSLIMRVTTITKRGAYAVHWQSGLMLS